MKELLDAIPSNWCDSLLTGDGAVIGNPPYDCQDIERLLLSIRARIETIAPQQKDSVDCLKKRTPLCKHQVLVCPENCKYINNR